MESKDTGGAGTSGRRGFVVLSSVSILFGLALGVYEFVLPLYLDSKDISFASMGYIFGAAGAATFLVRIAAAGLSDMSNRKVLYSVALALSAAANFVTPTSLKTVAQSVFKSVQDSAVFVRDSMHTVLIYEVSSKRFLDLFGKTKGFEFVFRGAGTMVAGVLITVLSFESTFRVCAAAIGVAWLVFVFGFKETPRKRVPSVGEYLKKVVPAGLNRNLILITVAGFIFYFGISCSHSFILPLFFLKKFSLSEPAVAVILTIHRILRGLPMFFVGWLTWRHKLKRWYIVFMVYEGLSLMAGGLIPQMWPALLVWLTHDLLGAGIWMPIQSLLIQRFSRRETRATDVSLVASISYLGVLFGPVLAGQLASIEGLSDRTAVSLPFIASGILVALAAVPLLWLKVPTHAEPEGVDEASLQQA